MDLPDFAEVFLVIECLVIFGVLAVRSLAGVVVVCWVLIVHSDLVLDCNNGDSRHHCCQLSHCYMKV